jgi:hypothetical protein
VPLFLVPVSAVILYGVISLAASRLVYQPSRYPDDWWNTQAELGARDVWRRARDGVRLHAWWVEGARHQTIVEVAGPRYRARLRAFYESIGLAPTG